MGDSVVPVQACFPSQCSEPAHAAHRVARSIAEAAYEGYAAKYGRGQSFEQLHERGGFSWGELIMEVPDLVPPHRPVDWRTS